MAAKTKAARAKVVALASFVGAVKGVIVTVEVGDTFDASDPIVKNWPELFGPVGKRG